MSNTPALYVGDILQDNDPRMMPNQILEVIEVLPNGVVAKNRAGKARIYLRHRIFTDGKPRKSGLSRVSSPHLMKIYVDALEPQPDGEKK